MDNARSADLGASLRRIRQERQLGVRELARRSDLSASLISRIESGTVMPSVATLFALQSALEVTVAELLGETVRPVDGAPDRDLGEQAHRPLFHHDDPFRGVVSQGVQRGDRRNTLDLGAGVHWERLTPGPDAVQFTYNVYKPGGASSEEGRLLRHPGREYGYVIAGRLHVRLAFETHVLSPGDSIAFDSSTPHRLSNEGTEDAVSIWVAVPG